MAGWSPIWMQGKGSSGTLSTITKSCSWGHPCGFVGISLTPGLSLTANDSLYNNTFFITLPLHPFPIMTTPFPHAPNSQLQLPCSDFLFSWRCSALCSLWGLVRWIYGKELGLQEQFLLADLHFIEEKWLWKVPRDSKNKSNHGEIESSHSSSVPAPGTSEDAVEFIFCGHLGLSMQSVLKSSVVPQWDSHEGN